MIELVRAGRTPENLASEFGPSAQAIRNWRARCDHVTTLTVDGSATTLQVEPLPTPDTTRSP